MTTKKEMQERIEELEERLEELEEEVEDLKEQQVDDKKSVVLKNMNINQMACKEAYDAIMQAFEWGNSPEGSDYWAEVANRLEAYSEFSLYKEDD